MSYLMDNIPYFPCYIRKEYLHDREKGHGEFIRGHAHCVRCFPGDQLRFQCMLGEPYGGANFLLPLEALCHEPCPQLESREKIQKWDCFSAHFSVFEMDFYRAGAAFVLPDWIEAQYGFSIDFGENALAEDPDQHKILHVVFQRGGHITAWPNTRLLLPDPNFHPTMKRDFEIDLKSLDLEARAEGHQEYLDPLIQPEFADAFKQAFPGLDYVEDQLKQRAAEFEEIWNEKEPA